MNHKLKMHELGSGSFDETEGGDEGDEDEEDDAALSFAAEATGMLKPALPMVETGGHRKGSTATSRRRSSSGLSRLSSFDDTAYNMFGGEEGHFSHNYMVSKWKKEARQQFEEAHGKRRTR